MKKKLFSLLIAGVLTAVSLTGCTNTVSVADQDRTSGSNESVTGDTVNNEAGTATDETSEKTLLRLAVMTGGLDQYIDEVGEWQGIFDKHGLDVEITE